MIDQSTPMLQYCLEKRRLRGNLIRPFKYPICGYTEGERVFSVAAGSKIRSNSLKLGWTLGRISKYWNSLPGGVVESPPLELSESTLYRHLGRMVQSGMILA